MIVKISLSATVSQSFYFVYVCVCTSVNTSNLSTKINTVAINNATDQNYRSNNEYRDDDLCNN